MKYSNTSRVLSTIFHGIMAVGFAVLGIYFGLIAAPYVLTDAPYRWAEAVAQQPYNLYFELGVIGLTLSTISSYGLFHGIKSLINQRDDAPVIKAFNAFLAEGYIAGLFCLLNAAVFFDLIRGNNLAFIIVVMVILFIGLMIATNIPMVKIYDNKDQTPLLSSFAMGAGVYFCWSALVTLGTLIGALSHDAYAYSRVLNPQLTAYFVTYLVIAALLILSGIFLAKSGQNNEKLNKLAGHFTSLAVALTSFMFIANGVIALVFKEKSVHLQGVDLKLPTSGDTFAIMCLVVGGILFVGSIVFEFVGVLGGKKEKKA